MEHGLIKDVEIRLVKHDEDLYDHIIKARNIIDEEERARVKNALRYNVFSLPMFSDMSGLAKSSVSNLMRPLHDVAGELYTGLDFTFMFPGIRSHGRKFIVRNEKSERVLKR